MKHSDTIILHDAFAFKGGGERLIHILCRELEETWLLGIEMKKLSPYRNYPVALST